MIDSDKFFHPAFPTRADENDGMTLRDWFAGMAISGDVANSESPWLSENFPALADRAYRIADAMLERRDA